jgi:CRISPR-associated protein Cas1
MSVLEISKSGISLSVRSGFLLLKDNGNEEKIPLDDIDCIIMNSYGAALSNRTLIRLCNLNIPLVICGSNAVPIGILQANSENVYRKERIQSQISARLTLKKRIWQTIIRAKVLNQATLLQKLGRNYRDIALLSERVKPGDSEYVESISARLYWKRLFGPSFKRDFDQPGINAHLNYGYAIIRAAFCQNITAAGMLPELGIHHKNLMNPFCLADDLLEPYRPFVDEIVQMMNLNEKSDLVPENKRNLISILDKQIISDNKKVRLKTCINVNVNDLAYSYRINNNLLKYPILE